MAKDTPTKTTTATPSDEEVKFLLSIIKVAGIGTIDWQAVADANTIVSKAAASKRFSRLNVKYKDALAGIKEGADGKVSTDGSASPRKGRGTKVTPKKRKIDEVEEGEDDDEEDGKIKVKGEAEGDD
ncbi:hypothetical protein B0A48_09534 [Cryoendolithus antarcticus]|uniref:Myb-like DNA-binding domain-containing protein n=1 Tax=Cryoendolithus antarcticus TaxID=1507870 RepID=A0A1V8T0C7_9PEZI|nr:hypothetical protein B0A48_09534 [Cryoendolithus antarcticus]